MQHGGFAKGREEALLVRGLVESGGVMFELSDDFFGDFRYMHSSNHTKSAPIALNVSISRYLPIIALRCMHDFR